MNLKETKMLVTGADGFIGSYLPEELVRRGHDVRAFMSSDLNGLYFGEMTC